MAERDGSALTGRAAVRASSGLGRATAIALARAGANVALLACTSADLGGVAAEVSEAHRRVLP